MARFSGIIGFGRNVKNGAPGVFEDEVIEKRYKGDITRDTRQWKEGVGINDDLKLNNIISIVADSFCLDNLAMLKYVYWMKVRWKVSNVEIQYPRLILTLGEVYNGPIPNC